MLILLVGMPSSGKTTVARILAEMGFSVASTGDVIRDEIKRRDLPYTKENDRKVSDWFHDGREDLVVERLLERLEGDRKVVDGLMDPEQVKKIRKATGEDPVIVAIKADRDSRMKREMKRKRFEDVTEEYFRKREEAEKRLGRDRLLEMADYTIDNTDLTREELKSRLKELLKSV